MYNYIDVVSKPRGARQRWTRRWQSLRNITKFLDHGKRKCRRERCAPGGPHPWPKTAPQGEPDGDPEGEPVTPTDEAIACRRSNRSNRVVSV